jgi:folate-dependent phosphoribosylglycinamide formyltransferase PurN
MCLAGYLLMLEILPEWRGRILNIHPSLLPLFGGRGMYGQHVHEAVLASGMRVSGCSVHIVTEEYDAGPIVAQRCVPIEPGDSPASLGGPSSSSLTIGCGWRMTG